MTRQIITHNWKAKITGFNPETNEYPETEIEIGRFTAATVKEKINKKYPEYRFQQKWVHGFGGYWVNDNGDTLEVLPSFKNVR